MLTAEYFTSIVLKEIRDLNISATIFEHVVEVFYRKNSVNIKIKYYKGLNTVHSTRQLIRFIPCSGEVYYSKCRTAGRKVKSILTTEDDVGSFIRENIFYDLTTAPATKSSHLSNKNHILLTL